MRSRVTHDVFTTLVIVVSCLLSMNASAQQFDDDHEETVCGFLRERLVFALWSSAAGKPNPQAAARLRNAAAISHTTRDGRTLRGYKLAANLAAGTAASPAGFVLLAQGNAMLADQLLDYLNAYTVEGYDVYVFDYRGYGSSEGRRRLKAIVGDYRELFAWLSAGYSGRKLLYGISFGGIVISNVIGSGAAFDRAVIDSAPSRISGYGCPKEFDPVANLPADSSALLLINGALDTVVPAKDSAELLDTGERNGARVIRCGQFAHPFMDVDLQVRLARFRTIQSFLLGQSP